MTNEIDAILGDLSKSKDVSYDQRLADKAKQIANAPKSFLMQQCQGYQSMHKAFWDDQFPPQAIAGAMGLQAAKALFGHAKDLAGFLAAKLAKAGIAEKDIASLLPGVPENYVVNEDAENVADFIAVRMPKT